MDVNVFFDVMRYKNYIFKQCFDGTTFPVVLVLLI